jgi:hypothetical protein
MLLPIAPEMLPPIAPEMLLPHDQSRSPAATLAMILDFVFEDLVGPTLFQGSCFPNSTAYSPFSVLDWSDLSDPNKGRDIPVWDYKEDFIFPF